MKDEVRLARSATRAYAADPGLYESIVATGGIESVPHSEVKRIEYSILVQPVVAGLEKFLDDAEQTELPRFKSSRELMNQTGHSLARYVIAELQEQPHFLIASSLAKRRSEAVPAEAAPSLYPLGSTTTSAAVTSANSLFDSACAAAVTLRAGGLVTEREDFITKIKNSTGLPLARTFLALTWQQPVDEAIYEHATKMMSLYGPEIESEILEYDFDKHAIEPSKPLEQWPDHLNLSGQIEGTVGDVAPLDEQIGCPVSFSPKLVVRYYHYIVDLIDANDFWPVSPPN
jgi:hypothetical protein